MDTVKQKNSMSGLLERFRPLLDSKLGPFLLLLTVLIVLSWVLQVVGFAFGLFDQPSAMIELLTGPLYTTLLVVFTLIAMSLAVDAIEKDKHSRAREYASAYEEVANAYKEAANSTEELRKQVRSLARTHALTKLFISISQKEREVTREFTVAETALRSGDLARAQEAINRLDSNRATIDEYLKAYFPEHETGSFAITADERDARIEGESECPSTSSKLKYKELKIIQPKWSTRFQQTMSRLESEIGHNRDGM